MQRRIDINDHNKAGCAGQLAHPPCSLVFWDWNGTLLDDLHYAIGVRNRTFPRFGLTSAQSVAQYHDEFTFPIRRYYERAGGTEESFVEVAHAWMDEYVSGMGSIPLHEDAVDTLKVFQTAGLKQVALSASNIGILTSQLAQYNLAGYFQAILGLSHIYATSKQAIGQAYLRDCGIAPGACVLLGDTLHDAEVAREMGVHCILIAKGHQNEQTLQTAGCPICGSLREAAALILGREPDANG